MIDNQNFLSIVGAEQNVAPIVNPSSVPDRRPFHLPFGA